MNRRSKIVLIVIAIAIILFLFALCCIEFSNNYQQEKMRKAKEKFALEQQKIAEAEAKAIEEVALTENEKKTITVMIANFGITELKAYHTPEGWMTSFGKIEGGESDAKMVSDYEVYNFMVTFHDDNFHILWMIND